MKGGVRYEETLNTAMEHQSWVENDGFCRHCHNYLKGLQRVDKLNRGILRTEEKKRGFINFDGPEQ